MTRRLLVPADAVGWVLPLALILSACLLAACGEKEEPAGGGTDGSAAAPLKVMLDYFPNADHAGLYAAQAEGIYEQAGAEQEGEGEQSSGHGPPVSVRGVQSTTRRSSSAQAP